MFPKYLLHTWLVRYRIIFNTISHNMEIRQMTTPKPSRRKFLKILGGGTILAATSATTFALTRTPRAALAP